MIDRKALVEGFMIPPLSREGTYQHWNRYAAVNHEFADHHMDDEIGRHEGFEAAFGMAPLIEAYVHAMLREWVAKDEGRVAAVAIQLRSPFLRKRVLTAHGKVTSVRTDGDELRISLEIWADNDEGKRLINGTAEVALPAP